MAQRYWDVYIAIRDHTDLPPEPFEEYLEHIRWETTIKLKGYAIPFSEDTCEELCARVIAAVVHGITNGNFNPERGTFKNWSDGTVRNVIRKHVRDQSSRQGQHQSWDEVSEDAEVAATYGLPLEEYLLSSEGVDHIHRALDILEQDFPRDYAVLLFRCFYEQTTSETAAALDMEAAEVSRRLNRARQRLLHTLQAEREE